MTEKEKRQWLDAEVEWDDYPDNPTLEEARAERKQTESEARK